MSGAIAALKRTWSKIAPPVNWQGSYRAPLPPKYTVQPEGFGRFVNRLLAIDPERSTGVPFNKQFRTPTPGALDPNSYDDPTTVPAADIADNPYWKRDTRRSYPMLSTVTQGDVVALLSVGSQAAPKDDVLRLGDAGSKQLVEVKQAGEERGLAAFFQEQKSLGAAVLSADGLPPTPPSLHNIATKRYELSDQSYKNQYPCRSFE